LQIVNKCRQVVLPFPLFGAMYPACVEPKPHIHSFHYSGPQCY